MILEILDIIEAIIIITPVLYLLYIILKFTINGREKTCSFLKFIIGMKLSVFVCAGILIIIAFQTYQFAQVWQLYEAESYLDPVVKQVSYMMLYFIWSIIGVVLILFIQKFFVYNQLIPGHGTVRERLSKIWKELKKKKNG